MSSPAQIREGVSYPGVIVYLKAIEKMPAAECPVPKNQLKRALSALVHFRDASLELAAKRDAKPSKP